MSMDDNRIMPEKRSSSQRMILVLGLVATLSGFLVVSIFYLTAERIAENKRIAIEKAVFEVVPAGAVNKTTWVVNAQGVHQQGEGTEVYAAYNAKGQLLGIALEGAAQGYADMIRLIYGYDPACQCITGFRVIKMAETPGLGDRIIHDRRFLQNFIALDAQLNPSVTQLQNAIITVKHGSKQHPWQIDAISGATISSKAVGKAINQSAQQLLPILYSQLDRFLRQEKQLDD